MMCQFVPSGVAPSMPDAVWAVYEAAKEWATNGAPLSGIVLAVDAALKAGGTTGSSGSWDGSRGGGGSGHTGCPKGERPVGDARKCDKCERPLRKGETFAGFCWDCWQSYCRVTGRNAGDVGRRAAEAVLADAEKEKPEAPACSDCGSACPDVVQGRLVTRTWVDGGGRKLCGTCVKKRARIARLRDQVQVGDVVTTAQGQPFEVAHIMSNGMGVTGKWLPVFVAWESITAVFKRGKE